MNKNPNKAIVCDVKSCEYNCKNDDYCSLEKIRVTTHETDPTKVECTDCGSFKFDDKKDRCGCHL